MKKKKQKFNHNEILSLWNVSKQTSKQEYRDFKKTLKGFYLNPEAHKLKAKLLTLEEKAQPLLRLLLEKKATEKEVKTLKVLWAKQGAIESKLERKVKHISSPSFANIASIYRRTETKRTTKKKMKTTEDTKTKQARKCLENGTNYPFDASDAWWSEAPDDTGFPALLVNDWTRHAARGIADHFSDLSELKNSFRQMFKPEDNCFNETKRKEIIEILAEIIKQAQERI